MKKVSIAIVAFLVLITAISALIFLRRNNQPSYQQKETRNSCLSDNEIAEYKLEKNFAGDYLAKITIKDKNTNNIIFEFPIDNVDPQHYHPIELYKCGIYIVKKFNYDSRKSEQAPGFKAELWKYDYGADGEIIILLAEKPKEFISYFSYDFRIDPFEQYLVLQKSYLGSPDHAFIIKDLKTLNDVFMLSMKEIKKQNPNMVGNIGFESATGFGWTKDSRYFWADTAYGANVLGFIRIDTQNWSADLFPAPKDILGGDVLNFENGWLTVHSNNVWFGISEIYEQEKEKRRKQGMGTELHIHNLITGERQFVASTTEPLHYFKPRWISDNELRYIEPNGERKVYKIKE